nr:probable serine/threonine-protein kinase PIX13 [Tanacetum cinerariifolium]
MDPRLNQDYPSKGASKTAELILSCLESDPKKRPSMEDVVLSLQDINAIKMKPTQLKSLVNNPRHSVSVDSKSELDRYPTEEIEGDEAYFKSGDFTVLVDVAVNLEKNIDDLEKFEDEMGTT